MFKFLFKSKFLGFVEAPVGVFTFLLLSWPSGWMDYWKLELISASNWVKNGVGSELSNTNVLLISLCSAFWYNQQSAHLKLAVSYQTEVQ